MEEQKLSDTALRNLAKQHITKNAEYLKAENFHLLKTNLLKAIHLYTQIIHKTDDTYYELASLHYRLAALFEYHFHNKSDAKQHYQQAIDYMNMVKFAEEEDAELITVYQWHLKRMGGADQPKNESDTECDFSFTDAKEDKGNCNESGRLIVGKRNK